MAVRYGMTIETLAERVFDDFKKAIKENGFKDFEEMKTVYWWDASDIRSEIVSTAEEILGEEYEADLKEFGDHCKIPYTVRLHVMDDDSIDDFKHRTTYGQFKKMVMAHLK